jgi:archaellum component FlaC
MTNIPPVALRLADEMERVAEYDHQTEAAAELRRLHAEVERLQENITTLYAMYEQVSRQRDAVMDEQRAMIAAMRGRVQ